MPGTAMTAQMSSLNISLKSSLCSSHGVSKGSLCKPTDGKCVWFIPHSPVPPHFLELGCNWHYFEHMLKTWVGTRVVGTNILDHSVWDYVLRFSGSGMPHVCLANWISFSFFFLLFFLPLLSRGVFFVCSSCLLTLWQAEKSLNCERRMAFCCAHLLSL